LHQQVSERVLRSPVSAHLSCPPYSTTASLQAHATPCWPDHKLAWCLLPAWEAHPANSACMLPCLQEVAAWYARCNAEKQGRLVAERALQNTLGASVAKFLPGRAGLVSTAGACAGKRDVTAPDWLTCMGVSAAARCLPILWQPAVQSSWSTWSRSAAASAAC
jgi:hypothetical protein